MKKRYEFLIILVVLGLIIGLGLWRAISLSIPHPSLLHPIPSQTYVPLSPPIYSTSTP